MVKSISLSLPVFPIDCYPMRRVFKVLLRLGLLLFLVVLLFAMTIQWWAPAAFNKFVPDLLLGAGFSKAELSLDRVGLSRSAMTLDDLRFRGYGIADTSLGFDYDLGRLRDGVVDRATLTEAKLKIDLDHRPPEAENPGAESGAFVLPKRFPITRTRLLDSELVFQGDEWARSFEMEGSILAEDGIFVDLAGGSEGMDFELRVESLWPELSGRATLDLSVGAPASWIELLRQESGFGIPENSEFTLGSLSTRTVADFSRLRLREWNTSATLEDATLSLKPIKISLDRLKLDARGKGKDPENIEAQLFGGYVEYEDLNFTFDESVALTKTVDQSIELSAVLANAHLSASAAELKSEKLAFSVSGHLPKSLRGMLSIQDGHLSWSGEAGVLTGLEGSVQLAALSPPRTDGGQTLQFKSIKQGSFTSGAGQVRFSYAETLHEEPPLSVEFEAPALGGNVRIVVRGRVFDSVSLSMRVYMEAVALTEVALIFPQFEGRIEGTASGVMEMGLENGRFILKPGSLQMTPDTVGRFEYKQQGWMTQDPNLNPEAFVKDLNIVEIMKNPKGASIITELALRDLTMSEFKLMVLDGDSGKRRALARIEGESTIKGVTIPVVLDVPIRGDLKETINAVLQFRSRM